MQLSLKRLQAALLGEESPHFPERVHALIERQQNNSEILIGWVQFSVVCVFGILYAVSPKTFGEEADFAPVPFALAGYFAFTLWRLTWAYRGRLPRWFLSTSVIIDILLLMGLIWSFHLQYQHPPAFYLKAPTLLYVFIFIALRALTFSTRYVFLTGAAAAFGWLAMVLYAAFGTSAENVVMLLAMAAPVTALVLLVMVMD